MEREPRPPGAKKLVDEDGAYRVRVGNYRIVYDIEDGALIVLVLKVGNRRDVYKKRR